MKIRPMTRFQNNIEQITSNQSAGSSILLKMIIDEFLNYGHTREEVKWAINKLKNIDREMAVVYHFLRAVESYSERDFKHRVQEYADKWKRADKEIFNYLLRNIEDDPISLLVHSHSGVIMSVVQNLSKKGYEPTIFQTASAPEMEGLLQAEYFKGIGLDVTTIADDRINNYIKDITLCLLGVDHYSGRGFVNKIGSKNIVNLAFKQNIPVYVLGDSRKMVSKITLSLENKLFEMIAYSENIKLINEKGEFKKTNS